MNALSVVMAISGGGVVLGVFAAALLLRRSGESDARADAFLALLMLLCSLNIAHALLGSTLYAPPGTLRSQTIEPFLFLLPPAVAAYARMLVGSRRRFRPASLAHALPFAAVVALLSSPLGALRLPQAVLRGAAIATWTCLLVQGIAYLLPVLRVARRYREEVARERSNLSGIDVGWLLWFSRAIIALYALFVLVIAALFHAPESMALIRPAFSIALSAVAAALGYRGLRQPKPLAAAVPAGPAPKQPAQKYERVAIGAEEALALAARADGLMERERPYLDPDLDLAGLARRLGAPRNQLSYALNGIRGTSFYDYVNGYRVREAIRLIGSGGVEGPKLLAVALDSGFSSKATFNAVFKKTTGLTPSQYREGKTVKSV